MVKTILRLDKNYRRPIFNCTIKGMTFRALLDTGALVPVWVKNENKIIQISNGKMIRNVTFGGFGGTIKGVNAYFINLKLGDIEFSDMPVIASKLANAEFDIVLPATLFKDIVYTINMWDYKIEINSMLKNIKINFKINKDMWISILLTDTYEESNIKYIERIINFNPTPQDIEANYINNLINNQDTP